ncbi:MAG: GFA family protein [Gammaproteobacteria bacterium]|nr:GFA family protein [Gammaproteobacteria bacterium]
MSEHRGKCFCGTVEFVVSGEPVAMGYCHCESCRHWSAGPINAFTLWQPDSLRILKGAEHIDSFNKTANSQRKWCKSCGGHLFTNHPSMQLVDVYAAVLPTLAFKPSVHVNYGEKAVSVRDGLPKLKDFPKEMGGSGVTLPE